MNFTYASAKVGLEVPSRVGELDKKDEYECSFFLIFVGFAVPFLGPKSSTFDDKSPFPLNSSGIFFFN